MENQLTKEIMERSTMEGGDDSNVTFIKRGETPTDLQSAVKRGNIQEVDSVLRRIADSDINRNHEDVNARDKDGMTPLLVASLNGYVKIAEILLRYGARIDSACTAVSDEGSTSLHLAIKNGHHELVELLLKNGANVNATDEDRSTPLHIATKKNDAIMVKRLLRCSVNVDAENDCGQTALCIAIVNQNRNIVDYILKCRPDVYNTATRRYLKVAMRYCRKETGRKIFEDLIKFGFTVLSGDVDKEFLYDLVEYGLSSIVLDLLRYDIDINTYEDIFCNERSDDNDDSIRFSRRYGGCTFLCHAVKYRCHDLSRLLINYGFDPNAKDAHGRSVFAYAVMNADVKMINTLLSGGFHIDDSADLLRIAVQIKSAEMVQLLLEQDPSMDINARDDKGRTALHFIALDMEDDIDHFMTFGNRRSINISKKRDDEEKIVNLLLNRGAHVNATLQYEYSFNESVLVSNVTTLHVALDKDYSNLVNILLEYNANVDSMDAFGQTPLHIASIRGRPNHVQTLLNHNCDINVVDTNEQTPLQLAINTRTPDIIWRRKVLKNLLRGNLKILALGQFVSERNLHCIDFNDSFVKLFFEDCKEEVEEMKREKIGNSDVSCYQILTEDAYLLIPYLSGESIVEALKLKVCTKKFMLYSKMLEHKFKKAALLISGAKSFDSLQ